MSLRKDKKKVIEAPVETGLTPHDIGLHKSVEYFHAAHKAAEEDLAIKKAAYQKSKTKYDTHEVFNGEKQYEADKKAYYAVRYLPSQIPKGFYEGACEAFLDNRPDNIQYIMSHIGEFSLYLAFSENLAVETLVALMEKSAAPETVPGIALAGVMKDEQQYILDNILLEMVSRRTINEGVVFALLDAGADASYNSNQIMARALHNRAPDRVIDRLLEKGADCDAALQLMYNNGRYGTTPLELTILQQDAKIRALQEAFAELARTLKKPDAELPAPAAQVSATRLKMRLSANPQ